MMNGKNQLMKNDFKVDLWLIYKDFDWEIEIKTANITARIQKRPIFSFWRKFRIANNEIMGRKLGKK